MDVEVIPGIRQANQRWRKDQKKLVSPSRHADDFDDGMDFDELFGSTSNRTALPTRRTDHLLISDAEALNALLETHGLAAVIATLRMLCDSRGGDAINEHDDLETSLNQEEQSDAWRAAGDALETLATSGKVNVR